VDLQLSQADISPQATAKALVVANLDSTSTVLPATAFNPADPTTYTSSTSMSTYDTLGNAHTLSMYFLKSAANTWQVFAAQDAAQVGAATSSGPLPAFVSTAGGTYTLDVGGVSILAAAAAPVTAANVDTAIAAATAALTAAGISTSGTAVGGTLRFNMTNGSSVTATETLGAGGSGGFFGGVAAGTLSQTFTAAFAGGVLPVGTIKFLPSGAIDTTNTTLPFNVSAAVTTGATSPLAYTLDFTGTTQFGSAFGVNQLTQDGFASGRLSGFSIGGDGVILGRYTNGQSRAQGQVVLANFTDPNGLQPLGNNNWGDTPQSGAALVGAPSTGSLGLLQSGAVEGSNVDLTAELVKMITAQRVYQANAQSIKTQDQVLQTLVNLR
jgi:flagellar hook protein FlgE